MQEIQLAACGATTLATVTSEEDERQSMVTVTIDNKMIQVPENTTILEAARMARIEIPTLCYLKDINEIGACRMCAGRG